MAYKKKFTAGSSLMGVEARREPRNYVSFNVVTFVIRHAAVVASRYLENNYFSRAQTHREVACDFSVVTPTFSAQRFRELTDKRAYGRIQYVRSA